MTQNKKIPTQKIAKLVSSFLTISSLCSWLLSGFVPMSQAHAESLPAGFDVLGYAGITIDAPNVVDENPNSLDHSHTLTVSLFPVPSADVTITATPTNIQCTVAPGTITIAAGQSSAVLTVTGTNDGVLEAPLHPCPLSFVFTSGDVGYNGSTRSAVVQVRDWNIDLIVSNNRPINENPLAADHTNTLIATLSDRPSGDVYITVTNDKAQCTFDTTSFVLTPTNWNTGVSLLVTAVNDKIVEQPTHPCTTSFASTATSAIEWRSRTKPLVIDVIDYNLLPVITVATAPKIVATGAKLLIAPIVGTLLVYGLWVLALRITSKKPDSDE
jgi:hypothetical protein